MDLYLFTYIVIPILLYYGVRLLIRLLFSWD